jgi:hypothetical protein
MSFSGGMAMMSGEWLVERSLYRKNIYYFILFYFIYYFIKINNNNTAGTHDRLEASQARSNVICYHDRTGPCLRRYRF